MKKLRLFTLYFIASLLVSAQQQERIARIGIIADIQYCDCDDSSNGRMYRSSLKRLNNSIPVINEGNADFTVNLGDIVDKNVEANLDTVMKCLAKFEKSVYHIMGNHDVKGIYQDGYKLLAGDAALSEYMRDLAMPGNYYYKETAGIIYIFLDTNEISSYSIDPDNAAEKNKELAWWKELIFFSGRNNDKAYNGAVSNAQFEWIESLLKKAEQENKMVIIFSHHPLLPENGYQALNNREIIELIDQYNCVRAVFSGHHHAGNIVTNNGIPIITLKGLIEHEAFAIVDVYPNRIELKGYGEMESQSFDRRNTDTYPVRSEKSKLKAYPSITSGEVILDNVAGKCLKLLNPQGRILKKVICHNNSETVDISDLDKGFYFFYDGTETAKIFLH